MVWSLPLRLIQTSNRRKTDTEQMKFLAVGWMSRQWMRDERRKIRRWRRDYTEGNETTET